MRNCPNCTTFSLYGSTLSVLQDLQFRILSLFCAKTNKMHMIDLSFTRVILHTTLFLDVFYGRESPLDMQSTSWHYPLYFWYHWQLGINICLEKGDQNIVGWSFKQKPFHSQISHASRSGRYRSARVIALY